MDSEEMNLELTIRYRDVEAKFYGKPDDVIRAFFGFMGKVLPSYNLAAQLTLTIDLKDLLASVRNLIAFTPEGPVVIVPREKLGGDKNIIMLNLIRAYVGYKTGRLEKDSLSTSEIMALTGGKSGTVAARLSELTDMGLVERVGRGEYRVTTLGIKHFLDEILPKIRLEEKDRVE